MLHTVLLHCYRKELQHSTLLAFQDMWMLCTNLLTLDVIKLLMLKIRLVYRQLLRLYVVLCMTSTL